MSLSKCLKYIPLAAMLMVMLWIVAVLMGGSSSYSDSTFVFSNQGQV